jgi:hypothetical protein
MSDEAKTEPVDTRYESEQLVEQQALRLNDAPLNSVERSRALNDLHNAIVQAKEAGVSSEAIDGIIAEVGNIDHPDNSLGPSE